MIADQWLFAEAEALLRRSEIGLSDVPGSGQHAGMGKGNRVPESLGPDFKVFLFRVTVGIEEGEAPGGALRRPVGGAGQAGGIVTECDPAGAEPAVTLKVSQCRRKALRHDRD